MKKALVLLLAPALIAIVALGCGGDEGATATPTQEMSPPTATPTDVPPLPTTTSQASASERGRQLVQQNGCLGCHSTDGSTSSKRL